MSSEPTNDASPSREWSSSEGCLAALLLFLICWFLVTLFVYLVVTSPGWAVFMVLCGVSLAAILAQAPPA